MRKFVLILFFVFVFLASSVYLLTSNIHAQDLDAQKAFKDYQYQQSSYLNSEAEYEEAKTFYKKNPTLQLREEARLKTLSFLKNRDQLMVVYLTALKSQITETTGFTNDEKSTIFGSLDPEIIWYQNHIGNFNDGNDLNTLFSKSDESKDRYQSSTKFVVSNSLFDISLSQEIGLRIDHQTVYLDLRNFIDQQVSQGKLKIDPFNRWLNDTDSILQILDKNEAAAKVKIPSFYAKNYSLNTTYTSSLQILNNSVGPLMQLNNYLTEMLTYIQSQQL